MRVVVLVMAALSCAMPSLHPTSSLSLFVSAAFSPTKILTFTPASTALNAEALPPDDSPFACTSSNLSRRAALIRSTSAALGPILLGTSSLPTAAHASNDQVKSDKEKIVKGYQRLTFLLQNWDEETTVCGRNDNPYIGCERTPEKVMEYLGYKSIEDPLYRADKTMIRLQTLVPEGDAVAQGEFQDALDLWVESAEDANGLAFVSSWGEANPGGGKDRVELFIERSRKSVEKCQSILATVIRILDLNPAV